MLHGYNNDIEYRGKEFHIQTEDLGESVGKIESQIFHKGQILDTETVPYDSVVEEAGEDENVKKKLKSLLQATHKGLYERLVSGEYDEMVGLEPIEEEPEEVADPEEFEPGQDRVPDAAMEVEEEGEEAFQKFHSSKAQKHVDLEDLKGQLDDVGSDVSEEEGEEAPAEPESEVDEALAGVGSELGEIAEAPDLAEKAELKGGDGSGDGGIDTNATIPPGSMNADDIAEVSVDEDLEETSKVTRRDPSTSDAVSETLPVTGVRTYRGCEEVDGDLSIVPLVESFLDDAE